MTEEQFKKGKELSEKIKQLDINLTYWKLAKQFGYDNQCQMKIESGGAIHIPVSPETFTIIKALNISHWEKELSEAQAEFDKL